MRLIALALALALAATPAQSADVTRAWVTQLARDGYEDITVRRTWLGRVRIVAEKGDIRREVVINPATGEVLRDYSRSDDGGFRLPLGFDDDLEDDDREDRSGKGGGDDDEDDDEEDDEEDEEDNSGSGSSNSGSGSGSSGSGGNSGSGGGDDD